jgi:hypothetical protein
LKQGLDTIWRSILSAFFDMISQMIAKAIMLAAVKAILNLFTGGSAALGAGAGGLGAGIGGTGIASLAPINPGTSLASMSPSRGSTINNVTIQTFSPRDVLMQYTSPGGVLRKAQTRMASAGEY